MIIGIDGNEANIVSRVGVNQYGFELLSNLRKLQDEWKNKYKIIVYLKNEPLPDMPKESPHFTYQVLKGREAWILQKLTPHLIFGKPKLDIFFSPSHYVPPFSPIPTVCSIMDLGYLEFSGQFKKYDFWQLKFWSAYSIFISKAIIAISNSTKQDIVRHYPFASKKVFVTHLAYDKDRYNLRINSNDVRRVHNKYHIAKDYILFLSTLKPSKNIEGLLAAFVMVRATFPNISLVIAGKKGWLYEPIFKKVGALGLTNAVIFTDFIPEKDKAPLIKGAKAFVLPSFWEGFGLDALAALACGVPVVVSDKGSLPEVVGKAGIYVDPSNVDSIARGITKVLSLTNFEYNRLVRKGLTQARKFSWEKTARQTLKILAGVKK
ncbi:MAG: glycosyltransferase family 4 protein [Patescibacteria group bacterium]